MKKIIKINKRRLIGRFHCFVCKSCANKKSVTRFNPCNALIFKWAHLGLNQGPPDYESGALTS